MVKNGMVTLNGTVQSWQEKQLCAYVAKGVKGVRSLSNNLDIEDTTERGDAEIKLEVEEAIANDIRLYEKLIDVRVKDGVVGLSGTVGSLNEKQLAVSYAWTPGVKSVSTSALDINDWATNPRLRTEAYPSRTDKEIKSAIEDAFFYDPRVYEFNTKVTVDNGVAILSGKVDNLKAKRAAENDARNVVGVTFVRNNIRVKPDYIPENQSLEALIASSITLDPELEFYEIDVSAVSGKVYLEGEVDSWYEKYKAEDVASRVNGVTSIVNNLDVRETADFDYYYPMAWDPYPYPYISPEGYYDYPATDAQIYDNIQSELFWSPFVNKDDVVVTVNQGVATLSGTVDSPQERSSAIENAYEGGATSVIDMMNVSTGMDSQ
jgi:osmotically-inducible protein OsmY